MKTWLLATVVFAVVLIGGVLVHGVMLAEIETSAAPLMVTESAPEAVSAPAGPASIQPEGSCEADPLAPPGFETACCIDQCRRDKDCKFVCGVEFGGQCVQVNSCCRQCFCFGFAPGMPS